MNSPSTNQPSSTISLATNDNNKSKLPFFMVHQEFVHDIGNLLGDHLSLFIKNHLSESTRTSDYSHTTQQLDDYDEAEGDENEGRDVDVNNSSQEDNSLAEEEIDNHSTL
ncbi:unnamed protein product [Didymodactylos carnosus]|uniref:Uncharacterized protein n=1 Tax=Didymodactylos carnosus TaxID=1234261 RepID=A0A8S2PZ85_9BILA|nr:unnamed protein product [Didymodactylos carnosus]CAF4073047.1 unnamed protein product [Didymodactylos carnosus]